MNRPIRIGIVFVSFFILYLLFAAKLTWTEVIAGFCVAGSITAFFFWVKANTRVRFRFVPGALFSLFAGSLPRPALKSILRLTDLPSRKLQQLHGGHVGDYVAWLAAGVSLFGISFFLSRFGVGHWNANHRALHGS